MIADMATIPLKDIVKIEQLIRRVESGKFDAIDIDSLLIKLRPYARSKRVFREIADFVAHADLRNQGVSCVSMTGFADAMRFFVEYVGRSQALDISKPFPAYIYRLFRSQTVMTNEAELRQRFRVSHQSLLKKIEGNFKINKTSRMCSIRPNKDGKEFLEALQYVTGFIHSKPAFDIAVFHTELQELLTEQDIDFDKDKYRTQIDRVSLALLCLISGTEFVLPDGDVAKCLLTTEHHYRILAGKRKIPIGEVTNEPSHFGALQVSGNIQVIHQGTPITVAYPLLTTKLNPRDHCDATLFEVVSELNEFGEYRVEYVNLAADMVLTSHFRLVRAAVPS
jgi:hypothetical protein